MPPVGYIQTKEIVHVPTKAPKESTDTKPYKKFSLSNQKGEKYNELNSVLRSIGMDSDNSDDDDDFDDTDQCKYFLKTT